MDFVFQGFQSNLPVWGYLLLFLGTTALSWWSYRNITALSNGYRYGLITLRSSVFFILLILLLNPLFKAESTYLEKPKILVLMDNSASTGIEKGNYKGIESYKEVLEKLQLRDSSRVRFRYFALDQRIYPTVPGSLSFNGDGTNLFNMYEVLKSNQPDAAAAILISDGIFNQGRDPVFEAGNTDIPIHTIALGDTSQQKDLVVKSVITNTTGYVGTRQPVEVTVTNNGFVGTAFEVRLKRSNQIIDSRTVVPQNDLSSHEINFELSPQEEGLQQFTVEVSRLAEEWTHENNTHSFPVDVLDEKQRIISLAFEVHPDVKMLRSLLLGNENTRLIPRTWLGGSRFLEGSLEIGSDSLDLVIVQGFPENGVPEVVHEKLADLLEKVPYIVMATPKHAPASLERLTGVSLPVQQQGRPEYERVNIVATADPNAHPVMELPAVNLERMPPVIAPVYNLGMSAGTMLFTSSYQGSETQQPLIAVRQTGNLRQAQITGYGWFRAAQSSNPQDRAYTEQLFSNLVSWTATKPDDHMLDLRPAQTVFTEEQAVVLNAFLTNESGDIEAEAEIDITISGEGIQTRNYVMNNAGGGHYRLQLNALPEGIYAFDGTARKGNRVIDTRSGEFSVSSSNIEFVNTQRNDQLLMQIARRSGGNFYTYDDLNNFWDDLQEQDALKMEEKARQELFYPYQHALWFILIMILLTSEWLLRKYLALP